MGAGAVGGQGQVGKPFVSDGEAQRKISRQASPAPTTLVELHDALLTPNSGAAHRDIPDTFDYLSGSGRFADVEAPVVVGTDGLDRRFFSIDVESTGDNGGVRRGTLTVHERWPSDDPRPQEWVTARGGRISEPEGLSGPRSGDDPAALAAIRSLISGESLPNHHGSSTIKLRGA